MTSNLLEWQLLNGMIVDVQKSLQVFIDYEAYVFFLFLKQNNKGEVT